MKISLSEIAANAECMEAVEMKIVNKYRGGPGRGGPIKLRKKNRQGFYVIDDGHHRTLAAMLDGRTHIEAKVNGAPVVLSWRWPRTAPVMQTHELMIACAQEFR